MSTPETPTAGPVLHVKAGSDGLIHVPNPYRKGGETPTAGQRDAVPAGRYELVDRGAYDALASQLAQAQEHCESLRQDIVIAQEAKNEEFALIREQLAQAQQRIRQLNQTIDDLSQNWIDENI